MNNENEKIVLECKKFIQQLCWLGFNGSPYTDEQALKLQYKIANSACEFYKRIFNEDP